MPTRERAAAVAASSKFFRSSCDATCYRLACCPWAAFRKSEAWVKDRTGWTSSVMHEWYRRAARSAQDLRLGALAPPDQAIPELADVREPVMSTDAARAVSPRLPLAWRTP